MNQKGDGNTPRCWYNALHDSSSKPSKFRMIVRTDCSKLSGLTCTNINTSRSPNSGDSSNC